MTYMPATGSHPEPSLGLVKVKVKFTLEQAMKAGEGVEIWLYSFFNLSARWGMVVNAMPWPLGKKPCTHFQEAGWAPGLV